MQNKSFFIIILIPVFIHANSYTSGLNQLNSIKNEEIRGKGLELLLKNQENTLLNKRLSKETVKSAKERNAKLLRESRNCESKRANDEYYSKQRLNTNNEPIIIRKKLNPKDFKNTAQLKLDKLHIFGITSIEKFKENKLIIKGANGIFALPEDKFNTAEKINFNSELNKWN